MKTKNETPVGVEDVIGDVHVRDTMNALPCFLQGFITWLTGKPRRQEEAPLFTRSTISHIVTAYLCLAGGIVISIVSINTSTWWWLPIGWMFTVSGARKLITTINHYCVHRDLLPSGLREKFGWLHPHIADVNSALLFLQAFEDYKKEHTKHHDKEVVASIIDPDMTFLWILGFRTGLTKAMLWKVFLFNLFMPFSKLHRLFILSRIKTTLRKGNPTRWVVQLMVVGALTILAIYTSASVVFWAWIFPLTYLYHITSLIQFSSEHIWLSGVEKDGYLVSRDKGKDLIQRMYSVTVARFCGLRAPTSSGLFWLDVVAWTRWTFLMLFVHLPIRLFVLPGDLIVHDWHHRGQRGDDWANAFYAREKAIRNLKPGQVPFREIWGLHNVINMVFENLSKMDPIHPELDDVDDDTVLGM